MLASKVLTNWPPIGPAKLGPLISTLASFHVTILVVPIDPDAVLSSGILSSAPTAQPGNCLLGGGVRFVAGWRSTPIISNVHVTTSD